jgi:hypothetical protein
MRYCTSFSKRFTLGTSQNLLRGQISRLWRICVNQRFTQGKGPLLGANFVRSQRFLEVPLSKVAIWRAFSGIKCWNSTPINDFHRLFAPAKR